MPARPLAVAFDVIGTLFPIEPLRATLAGLGLPPQALEVWYAATLRDGFALAAAGDYRPFTEVGAGALDALLARHGRPEDPSASAALFEHLSRLPARPDAGAGMDRLVRAEVRVLALTNGSRKSTLTLLDGAGLGGHVERVVSIDDLKAWKPRGELYAYAAREAGLEPGQVALVAAHAWDCHGAGRAGFVTGWVSRPESRYNPAFGRPDVEGKTISDVVDALLRLPTDAA